MSIRVSTSSGKKKKNPPGGKGGKFGSKMVSTITAGRASQPGKGRSPFQNEKKKRGGNQKKIRREKGCKGVRSSPEKKKGMPVTACKREKEKTAKLIEPSAEEQAAAA